MYCPTDAYLLPYWCPVEKNIESGPDLARRVLLLEVLFEDICWNVLSEKNNKQGNKSRISLEQPYIILGNSVQ